MSIAEFQKLHDELHDIRMSGKLEELDKYTTDDCYFLTPLYGPYSKKESAALHKSGAFQAHAKDETTLKVDDVKVYGEIAVDRGQLTIKHPEGERHGCYLVVWKKEGGSWKMNTVCFNTRTEPKK